MQIPFDPHSFQKLVRKALRRWGHEEDQTTALLDQLKLFDRPVGSFPGPNSKRNRNDQILNDGMAQLKSQDEPAYDLLQKVFWEGRSHSEMRHLLKLSKDGYAHRQRAALTQLATVILRQEQHYRATLLQSLVANLHGIDDSPLFGVVPRQQALVKLLRNEGPPIIVVKGLGGIGKTALTLAAAKEVAQELSYVSIHFLSLAHRFEQPVSPQAAAQQLLLELTHQLWTELGTLTAQAQRRILYERLQQPRLIIFDNLEDGETVDALLAGLRGMGGMSKVVLTSRVGPSPLTGCRIFDVGAIDKVAARELVESQGRLRGIPQIAALSSQDFADIFAVTGGHPLALKLVTGLLWDLPLPQVLAQVRQGVDEDSADLYHNIYFSSWEKLSEPARQLLIACLNAPQSGATVAQLAANSFLSPVELGSAIKELTRRSLVESWGGIAETSRLYGIHRLTETFLHTEIVAADE